MSRQFVWALTIATILGATLRVWDLGRESLWLDELSTALAMSRPTWQAFTNQLRGDAHPPLFFALQRIFGQIAGIDEITVRLFPALAGIVCIPLVGLLGRAFYGIRSGAIAAFLLAVAPFAVEMSREGRSNSLLGMVSLLSLMCFLWWRGTGISRYLVAYGLTVAIMVWLHIFGTFVVIAQALWMLLYLGRSPAGRVQIPRWIFTLVLGVLSYLPWASITAGRVADFVESPWYSPPPSDVVPWLWSGISGGESGPALVLLVGLVLLMARSPIDGRGLSLLASYFVGMVFLPLAVSYGIGPILRDRNVLCLLPILCMVAGAGFARVRPGYVATLLATTAVLLCLPVTLASQFGPPHKEQWREVAAAVEDAFQPGDIVLCDHPYLWRHYLNSDVEIVVIPNSLKPDDILDWLRSSRPEVSRVWLLHGHAARPLPMVEAIASGKVILAEADLMGSRYKLVDLRAFLVPLTAFQVQDIRMVDADGLHFWWNTKASLVDFHPPRAGNCKVLLKGYTEDSAGENAKLALRLMSGGILLSDAMVSLPDSPQVLEVAEARVPSVVQMEIEFTNDMRVIEDGVPVHDRNAHIQWIAVRCE